MIFGNYPDEEAIADHLESKTYSKVRLPKFPFYILGVYTLVVMVVLDLLSALRHSLLRWDVRAVEIRPEDEEGGQGWQG